MRIEVWEKITHYPAETSTDLLFTHRMGVNHPTPQANTVIVFNDNTYRIVDIQTIFVNNTAHQRDSEVKQTTVKYIVEEEIVIQRK